jgi:hypothetical protein
MKAPELQEELNTHPGMFFAKIIHNQAFTRDKPSALITPFPQKPEIVVMPVTGVYIVFGEEHENLLVTNMITQDETGQYLIMNASKIPKKDIITVDMFNSPVLPPVEPVKPLIGN